MAYCIAVDSLFGSRQVFWTYKDRLSNQEGSEPKVGFPSLGNLTFEQLESLEMLATFGHEDYLYVETGRVRELWDRNGARRATALAALRYYHHTRVTVTVTRLLRGSAHNWPSEIW